MATFQEQCSYEIVMCALNEVDKKVPCTHIAKGSTQEGMMKSLEIHIDGKHWKELKERQEERNRMKIDVIKEELELTYSLESKEIESRSDLKYKIEASKIKLDPTQANVGFNAGQVKIESMLVIGKRVPTMDGRAVV